MKILKGFTLIELLVVIAIIAILAAILFPVFAQAREKARQASCLSNCKQIGTALQLYVDDYDETMPIGLVGDRTVGDDTYPHHYFFIYPWVCAAPGTYWSTWMDEIFPYVKNINMYRCPSSANKCAVWFDNNNKQGLAGYTVNLQLCGGSEDNPAMAYTMAQFVRSSETVFICDAMQPGSQTVATMFPALIHYWEGGNAGKAFRHMEGLNYTFADGHAKYYKKMAGPGLNGNMSDGKNCQYWDPTYNG